MQLLKNIYRMAAGLCQQVWRWPQRVTNAFKRRRRRYALDLQELERLDRIRHPSKYLGKS